MYKHTYGNTNKQQNIDNTTPVNDTSIRKFFGKYFRTVFQMKISLDCDVFMINLQCRLNDLNHLCIIQLFFKMIITFLYSINRFQKFKAFLLLFMENRSFQGVLAVLCSLTICIF
jgi:hypothetical protein